MCEAVVARQCEYQLQKCCEMYLQSDSNTCLLYKDVKDVTMYCNSGSGHGYYGNVKIENALNKDNVVDESLIVPPTSTPTPAPTTNPD